MRWIRRYTFLIMIIATSLTFGSGKVISTIEKQESGNSISSAVMQLEETEMGSKIKQGLTKLGILPNKENRNDLLTAQTGENSVSSSTTQENANRAEIEIAQTGEAVSGSQMIQQGENTIASSIMSSGENLTDKAGQESKKKEFRTVERSYWKDALFIGDSRTDTLKRYAGWKKTDFFVKTGISIWEVLKEKAEDTDKFLEEMLSEKQYKKIYIMFGINELAVGTTEEFRQQYETVLAKIRELQPEAIIFVQSIIHVTEKKDAEGTDIRNETIDIRNAELKKLADNRTIFWLDANEVLDEEGTTVLNPEYTFDGVHLKVKYLDVWENYLLEHGV